MVIKLDIALLRAFIEDESRALVEVELIRFLRDILEDNNIYLTYNVREEVFYQYSERDKYWKIVKLEEVLQMFWQMWNSDLHNLLLQIHVGREEESKAKRVFFFKSYTRDKLKTLLLSYAYSITSMPRIRDKQDFIPLQNGYIDLNNLEHKELDRNIYNRYVLPFSYVENSKSPKLFLQFLNSIIEDKEEQEFLINWMAYTLVPGNPRQKAFFLLGEGRNGKGVISRLMQKMVGANNFSNLSTGQIKNSGNNDYAVAGLNNKILNISPDSDKKDQLHTGTFKALTGGDTMTVRNIRGEPFEMEFFGKMWFLVNKMPYFSEKGVAVIERVEILHFRTVIDEKDRIPDLEDKILADGGDALFSFLIDRAKELSRIGFRFNAPASVRNFSRSHLEQTDTYFLFAEDYLFEKPNLFSVDKDKLFEDFNSFCTQNNFQKSNFPNFKEDFVKSVNSNKIYRVDYVRKTKGMVFDFVRIVKEIPVSIVYPATGDEELPF